jgi:aminoglycoside 3-N-acetyltransferase
MAAERFVYSTRDVVTSLERLGIGPGDTLLVHASLGRLGFPDGNRDLQAACRVVHDALRAVIGPRGTLLTPSYTYSAGKGEVFDPAATPGTVGPFGEFVRTLPGAVRSREPMLAMSGVGPASEALFADLEPTSYGEGSVYDRLCHSEAICVTIGLDLHWVTLRHHIEEHAGAPFRRVKHFEARLREPDGRLVTESWAYYAAPFLSNCAPDGNRLADALRSAGLLRAEPVGIGHIMAIGARAYRVASLPLLRADPWYTAKGPPVDDATMAAHMNRPTA